MANTSASAETEGQFAPSRIARNLSAWPPVLAFSLYALAILLVGARHEAWLDEAQAWLIARDATPLEIITRYGRYEGTPPLWHLILWVPAHLGYPYRYLWLFSGAFALVGAGVVLFRAPFPFLMRCGIVAGYFFAYQYPIVARSYVLDLVLFPVLAMLFEKRLERPLPYCGVLALLANTNAHSFLISAIFGLEYAVSALRAGHWKAPRVLAAVALYGVLALGAAAMTWPPKDVNLPAYPIGLLMPLRAILLMAEPFVERIDIWGQADPGPLSRSLGTILSLFLLIPSMVLFARARTRPLFLGAFGVFFAFTAFKFGQLWHAGILFMVWVFVLWVSWQDRDKLDRRERTALSASLLVLLGVQDWYTAAAWSREITETYSPGEDLAKVLADYRNAHVGATVAAFGVKTFAIQPWARVNLFDNFEGGAKKPAFYDWRISQPFLRYATVPAWTAAATKEKRAVLLLSDFEMISDAERDQYYSIAAKAGFCARTFGGQMIWKTYNREPLDIVMFTRCGV